MNPKNMPGYYNIEVLNYEDISGYDSEEASEVGDYIFAMDDFSFEIEVEVYVEPNKRSRIAKIVKGERLTGQERLERELFGGKIKWQN